MYVNPDRPIEQLVGSNYGIVRQILARQHCMLSVRELAREARPENMRRFPVALRRGWALCVMRTIAEYRATYIGVMACRKYDESMLTWRS